MADWENAEYGKADPSARRATKSSVQSSKAELLAAIAARRHAQLLRSSGTAERRSGAAELSGQQTHVYTISTSKCIEKRFKYFGVFENISIFYEKYILMV